MPDWVFPEDAATGAHDTGGDFDDAANFASAFHAIGNTDYVVTGNFEVSISRPAGSPELSTNNLKAVITDAAADAGQAGERRNDVAYVVEVDSRSGIPLADDAVNHVFVAVDLDANDAPSIVANTTGDSPVRPALKIASVDTTDDSIQYHNQYARNPGGTSVTVPRALDDGRAVADDGNIYASAQDAVDAAADWVMLGANTYDSVVVDDNDITITGVGKQTIIDGGDTSYGLSITGDDVTVRDIGVRTSPDANDSFHALRFTSASARGVLDNVYCHESAGNSFHFDGSNHRATNCWSEHAKFSSFYVAIPTEHITIDGCYSINAAGQVGFRTAGAYTTYRACHAEGAGTDGIYLAADSNSCMVYGNLSRKNSSRGLVDTGTNNITRMNRILGNSGGDYVTSGRTVTATKDDDNFVGF